MKPAFLGVALVFAACAPTVEIELRELNERAVGFSASKLVFTVHAEERVAFVETPPRAFPYLVQLVLPDGFEQEVLEIEVQVFSGDITVATGIAELTPGQKKATLQLAICSNGAPEGVEVCDDGNLTSGDGCDSTCLPTGCSSGVATPGELCFAPNDDLRGPVGPSQVLAADLDSDGAPDLVAPYPLDGVVRLYPGDGKGVFGTFIEVPVPGVRRLALGDLDGDGAQDLVALSGSAATVLLADGAGGFLALPGPEALGADIVAAELADLNGDGALDLVTLDKAQGALSWRPGNNDGSFGGIDPAGQILPVGASPVALALGDIDTDGDLDAVVALGGGSIRVMLNDGGGKTDILDAQFPPVGGVPSSIVLADLDGDVDLDLAVAKQSFDKGALSVFFGFGDGKFQKLADFDAPSSPSSLVAGDFDLDGDVDLATAGESGSVIGLQFNNSAAQFDAPRDASGGIFETREAPTSLVAADLNGDEVDDLVAAGVNLGLLLSNP